MQASRVRFPAIAFLFLIFCIIWNLTKNILSLFKMVKKASVRLKKFILTFAKVSTSYTLHSTYNYIPQLILLLLLLHFLFKKTCWSQKTVCWRPQRPPRPRHAAVLSVRPRREVMGNCISTFVVGGSLSQKDLIFKHFCSFLDTYTSLYFDFSSWSADLLTFFLILFERNREIVDL